MQLFPQIGRIIIGISRQLLIVALVLTIPAATHLPYPANLESVLVTFATTQPDTVVAIIVQKAAALPVEAAVIKLGGRITKNLSLINAFVAEIPARQLAQVAQLAGVRWVSHDAPVVETACKDCIDTSRLSSVYNQAIGADKLWNQSPYLQGQGIGIAVLDSGIQSTHSDLAGRIVAAKNSVSIDEVLKLPSSELLKYDIYGHGTFVAGLIAGNGTTSAGRYVGVAPRSQLINVRVTSLMGASTESDVVAGLQWVYENRATYNIRVVNLSLNASKASSYQLSPLSAACEILWFNGVVVVTSAGNRGEGTIYPPANDPFVITVGAADDKGTATITDDSVASFSAFGTTMDGVKKPDLVAPGRYIVGPSATSALLTKFYPQIVIDQSYMRMSGTSAAAPIVSGAIALLLQKEPRLTPDQVKQRLLNTANRSWAGYDGVKAGAGYLDINAAVRNTTTANTTPPSANTGMPINSLLLTGVDAAKGLLKGATTFVWDSVSWSSVSWSSVSWSSVSWSSVSWSSDYIENPPVSAAQLPPTAPAPTIETLTSEAALAAILVAQQQAGSVPSNAPSDVPSDGTSENRANQLYLPMVFSPD